MIVLYHDPYVLSWASFLAKFWSQTIVLFGQIPKCAHRWTAMRPWRWRNWWASKRPWTSSLHTKDWTNWWPAGHWRGSVAPKWFPKENFRIENDLGPGQNGKFGFENAQFAHFGWPHLPCVVFRTFQWSVKNTVSLKNSFLQALRLDY